jgi:uncharacterized protein (DUF433 family)
MGSTAPFDIGTLITCTPIVYGGRPCLAGTRFPILQIVAHAQAGTTPTELAKQFSLDLGKVHAGFAYYYANKAALDAEFAEDVAHFKRSAATQEAARGH